MPVNPGKLNGSLLNVRLNGVKIACETDAEFSYEVEMLPASAVDSARWAEFIPGIRSWEVRVDGNLLLAQAGPDFKSVLNAVMTGEELFLEFRTNEDITPYLIISGNVLPRSGQLRATVQELSNWTISFQGTGPFEADMEAFWLILNALPPSADKPLYVQQDTVSQPEYWDGVIPPEETEAMTTETGDPLLTESGEEITI